MFDFGKRFALFRALLMLMSVLSFGEKVTFNLYWFTWCVMITDDVYNECNVLTIDNEGIGFPNERTHTTKGPLCLAGYCLTRGFATSLLVFFSFCNIKFR